MEESAAFWCVADEDAPMEFLPSSVLPGDLLIMVSTPSRLFVPPEWWPGHGMPEGLRIKASKSIPCRVRR